MSFIQEFDIANWDELFSNEQQQEAVTALESGKVLYFPKLPFEFTDLERQFLSPDFVCPKNKNISYELSSNTLKGTRDSHDNDIALSEMMRRYAEMTHHLVNHLLPAYSKELQQARTSYRPVQVEGRPSSYRKDDTRLHVDAFPSTPMSDKRIIRVFSNVNHLQQPRIWRIGESFDKVAARFLPDIRKPLPLEAQFLSLIKATRGKRTPYDHYMTHIHNAMKADMDYQKNVEQIEFRFPPGSTWMVYTDQVSHAAMNGQYLLEQSFYLPVHAMVSPQTAPLKVLEKALGSPLV